MNLSITKIRIPGSDLRILQLRNTFFTITFGQNTDAQSKPTKQHGPCSLENMGEKVDENLKAPCYVILEIFEGKFLFSSSSH